MFNVLVDNLLLSGGVALVMLFIIAMLIPDKAQQKLGAKIVIIYLVLQLLVSILSGVKAALPEKIALGQVGRTSVHTNQTQRTTPPASPSEVVREVPFAESEGETSPSTSESGATSEETSKEATQASTVSDEEIQEGGTEETPNENGETPNEYHRNRGRGSYRFR